MLSLALTVDSSTYAHFVFNVFDQDRDGTVSFEVCLTSWQADNRISCCRWTRATRLLTRIVLHTPVDARRGRTSHVLLTSSTDDAYAVSTFLLNNLLSFGMKERVGDEKLIIISVAVRDINDHIRFYSQMLCTAAINTSNS